MDVFHNNTNLVLDILILLSCKQKKVFKLKKVLYEIKKSFRWSVQSGIWYLCEGNSTHEFSCYVETKIEQFEMYDLGSSISLVVNFTLKRIYL